MTAAPRLTIAVLFGSVGVSLGVWSIREKWRQ